MCVGDCLVYVHANFQDATIYTNKATREEVELFDQPSYTSLYESNFSGHSMKAGMMTCATIYKTAQTLDCIITVLCTNKTSTLF